MSKSLEQSISENAIILPVNESNPEFLHSEVERSALESLLRDGPEAFYTKLSAHQLKPFLSPEEVNQVSSWVEDHREEVVENGDNGSDASSSVQDVSDQYFPMLSDTPAPCLDLGWPEKDRWDGVEQVMVYTNPPVEQAPHVRQVIRRLLQGATMLIAIVADKLTDSIVIRDLHSAASRGVVVYIILNQRPAQDNQTPNLLKHPKIIVRILGGKKFMSADRKMVVGELKENFVLVDLETVVVGSYSLSWTDAHLHRHLITVLSGPAVQLFDQEFRILYAASQPVPESWNAAVPMELPTIDPFFYQPEPITPKQALLNCPPSPPPPTVDSPIDWEALGVFPKTGDSSEDQDLPEFLEELPKFYRTEADLYARVPGAGAIDLHITEWQDESRLYHVAAEPRHLPDHQAMFWNTQKPERLHYGFLTERDEGLAMFRHRDFRMERNLMEEFVPFSRIHRHESLLNLDRSWAESTIPEETIPGSSAAPLQQKKPIVVSVPQADSSWNLGDILKKPGADHGTMGLQPKTPRNTISTSTLDLSSTGTETLQRSHSHTN
ncbi:protein FAM83C-like, partial [Clarias magur]